MKSRPRGIAGLGVLILGIVCWSGVGCGGKAVQPAQVPPAAGATEPAFSPAVEQLVLRVRQEESRWRERLLEERRLRDGLMALPGNSGLGLAQKKLQHLAQQSGLSTLDLRGEKPLDGYRLVTVHPLTLAGEGELVAILKFLSKIEEARPFLGVLEYDLQRTRLGRGAPDRLRFTILGAVYAREELPAPPTPLPPWQELPAAEEEALHQLTSRLLRVQGTLDETERRVRLMQQALDLVRAGQTPIRAVFAPLQPLAGELSLARLKGGPHALRIEGSALDDASVQRFSTALQTRHPLLRPGTPQLERRRAHPGWESWFTLDCTLGPAEQQAGGTAPPPVLAGEPPSDPLPLLEPPPPAPVIDPASE